MRLVVDVAGDLTQRVVVFAGVVGTEEQLSATLELNAEVGLGATTIAAIKRRQCGCGGNDSSHIGLISSFGVTRSNLPNGGNIPLEFVAVHTHPITGSVATVVVLPSSEKFWSTAVPVVLLCRSG